MNRFAAAALRFSSVVGLACLIALFYGCRKDNNNRTIPEMLEHFKKSGIVIESVKPALFPVVKAYDGCGFYVGGKEVQIFKYDTRIPAQREKLERITNEKKICILAVDFPIKVNGSFIILNYKDNPREFEILKAFNSF